NYALALETYSLDMLPIFNTSLLRDHFIEEKIGKFADEAFAASSLCFEPAVDRGFFHPPAERRRTGKKRLLFYARPDAQRNLLEVGLGALMKVLAEGRCSPDEWEFFSTDTGVGGQCRPVILSDSPEVVLNPLPLRDLQTWAEEMRSVDIMLSLILSPHSGYPPLEAAACGALVVTNTWSVKTEKRLRRISPNILSGPPSIEGVAEVLARAMAMASRPADRENPPLAFPATWPESWASVMPGLLEFLAAAGIRPSRCR
ncbi:MAG: hypothetical protein LUH04_16890, partial [Clostridium sp.]|nr:hypothetical protein [Clostridium sp.]